MSDPGFDLSTDEKDSDEHGARADAEDVAKVDGIMADPDVLVKGSGEVMVEVIKVK